MFGLVVAAGAIVLSTLYKVSTAQLQQDTNPDDAEDTEHSKPWGTVQLMHALLPLASVALGVLVLCSNELMILQKTFTNSPLRIPPSAEDLHNANIPRGVSPLVPWIACSAALAFLVTLSAR